MLFMRKTTALPSATEALPGRATPIPTAIRHFVNGHRVQPPYPAGLEQAVFGLALQLSFLLSSESMGNHDSDIVDADGVG
jgi:hypothetical protein